MRYSVLGGGKRLRPLLVYATGEALDVDPELLDPPAAAIEIMHSFSLVHDDLPAMDDDDLRRGRPTTHRAFDEATAILAADALQPLAFGLLAAAPALAPYPESRTELIALLAESCGSYGMTGGQAIDLAAEGHRLERGEIEEMYRLKTGCLLRASVMSAAYCPPAANDEVRAVLEDFVGVLGLAYQIRDDILDIEGSTAQIGKQQGADVLQGKATFPAQLGLDAARERSDELLELALGKLAELQLPTEGLEWLAKLVISRQS